MKEPATRAESRLDEPDRGELAGRLENLAAQKALEFSAAAIFALALTYSAFRLHLTVTAVSSAYLVLVVAAAIRWGLWGATAATIVTFFCLDYFFTEPLFSFRVDGLANRVALGAFGFVGLVVSFLSARTGQKERAAIEEGCDIARLYELGRFALLFDRHDPPGPQIARLVQRAIGAESVALFDPFSERIDEAGAASSEVCDLARSAWAQHSNSPVNKDRAWAIVLRVGCAVVGAIAMRGKGLNSLVVSETASIVATALAQSILLKSMVQAEAELQCDRLRTALLDALSDAFKTPLASICAASSSLRETGALQAPHAELLELIDREAAYLGDLATRLLQTARLDRFDAPFHREQCRISWLIDDLLQRISPGSEAHRLNIGISGLDTRVCGSRELLVVGLFQLVDNALKYSPAGSPVAIGVGTEAREVVISVHNYGPTIGTEERNYIFERFYRAPCTKYLAPGTGLGLSITRKIAEAHGGRIWLSGDETRGTTFCLALPACPADSDSLCPDAQPLTSDSAVTPFPGSN